MQVSLFRPSRFVALLAAVLVVGSTAIALAQRNRGISVTSAPAQFPDGDFVICRLAYPDGRRFALGWQTDFPLGERNLSIRFGELTRTRVSKARDGSPNHYVVRITDDALFSCPFLMAGDVGSAMFSPDDATRLREYLLKGGFIWTDDMWGEEQWEAWKDEIAKVLPPDEYPIEELPRTDPLYHAQFVVREMPQIPNYGYWNRSGGDTSEMQELSREPHFHVIRDKGGRIVVAMTRNTDIADAFEREGENPQYFKLFGPPGYGLGINIILHAMTH